MTSKSSLLSVGIDLGTTYSVVAFVNESGRPETIPNSEGDLLTPSLILVETHQSIVGKEAAKAIVTDLPSIASAPKREVGQRTYHKEFHGHRYPPEVLQAWILTKVANDARDKIGDLNES